MPTGSELTLDFNRPTQEAAESVDVPDQGVLLEAEENMYHQQVNK